MQSEINETQPAENTVPSRRSFLGRSIGAVASVSGLVGTGLTGALLATSKKLSASELPMAQNLASFIQSALEHRIRRASINLARHVPPAVKNNDETLAGFIGSYSKGLPHNDLGEVDAAAFQTFVHAVNNGSNEAYAAIPMGGTAKQISPQASTAFQMEGQTSRNLRIAPPPAFDSEQRAAEMNEVYWMSLLRDVPFSQYPSNTIAANAITDLRRYNLFATVDSQTLFRGVTTGEKIGPYLSQFLWKTVPFGMTSIPQKYQAGRASEDFMTTPAETVRIQRGLAPSQPLVLDNNPHFMRNGRDLVEYVHRDFSYQAFLNAALILLSYGGAALDDNNPNKAHANRAGFVTFGGPDILSMVAQIGNLALKAAWYQKWQLHRTLRPEVYGLRVHHHRTNAKTYPIHPKLLSSPVLSEIFARNGNYCLPMPYAEGSPTHPSYPAGHATIAGACVTVLKAFFKESFVLPDPVVASDDGVSLNPYSGTPLTLGGELDKLAANISIGRNIAGVHYWSDGILGMKLGEQVALAFLADQRSTYNETFAGFTLTKFNGATVTI